MKDIQRTSVMIDGGGPVGLSMAMLLERFGVDCIVAERSPTTTEHPKARGCWVRTMEIFRQWGVETQIRDRALKNESDMFGVLRTLGQEYGRSRPRAQYGADAGLKSIVAQDAVEEEIFRKLREPAMLALVPAFQVVSFEETNDGVSIRTRRGYRRGDPCSRRFLIAADGAEHGARRAAGVEMDRPRRWR